MHITRKLSLRLLINSSYSGRKIDLITPTIGENVAINNLL